PSLSVNDQAGLAEFVESQQIDLTFVGPEAPLVSGLVDLFTQRGLRIVGPSAAAARLEGSKILRKSSWRARRYQRPHFAWLSRRKQRLSVLEVESLVLVRWSLRQ